MSAAESSGSDLSRAPTAAHGAECTADLTGSIAPGAPPPAVRLRLHVRAADSAEAAPADAPGRAIAGRYVVEEELGRGGMGVVHRAFDRELRRRVAMKLVVPQLAADERWLARFVEEAQATAQLQHPGIVPIYDIGSDDDGRLFFTMKLVRGRTLSELLREREPPSRYRLLQIFQEVCRTVAYAHERGVVHRDLKPQNVMIGPHGEVYVMDWGLAKVGAVREADLSGGGAARGGAASAAAIADDETVRTSRADAGGSVAGSTIIGTPAYMAPEQALGDQGAVGPATDIYALGAILYRMLTGRAPYEGAAHEVIARIQTERPPAPRALAPETPRELEAIALHALARDPAARYPSALALAEDVQAYLEGRTVSVLPDGPLRRLYKLAARHRGVAATMLVALVLGLVGTIAALVRIQRALTLAEARRGLAEAALAERDREAAGRRRALARAYLDRARLELEAGRIERAALLAAHSLEEGEGGLADPAESAEARGLAASLRERLPRRIWTARLAAEGPWSPAIALAVSKESILAATGTGLFALDPATGRVLGAPMARWMEPAALAIAPGGSIVAAALGGRVRITDVAGGQSIATIEDVGADAVIAISPGGERVAVGGLRAPRDGGAPANGAAIDGLASVRLFERALGTEEEVLAGLTAPLAGIAFAPGGARLAVATSFGEVIVLDPDAPAVGRRARAARPHEGGVAALAVSPDGRLVATAGPGRIVVAEVEGGREAFSAETDTRATALAFSPDGARLVSGHEDGVVRLWDVAGRRLVAAIEGRGARVLAVAHALGGARLAVASADGAVALIDVGPALGGGAVEAHRGDVSALAFSADGLRLATGGLDGGVRVFDAGTLAPVGGATAARRPVVAVNLAGAEPAWIERGPGVVAGAFDATGAIAAVGGRDGSVRVRKGADESELLRLDGAVAALAFDRAGARLLAARSDGTVQAIDVGARRVVATLDERPRAIRGVAFAGDGRHVATGTFDGAVRLRDPRTLAPIAVLEGPGGGVVALASSPDGRRLACGTQAGRVRVWDAAEVLRPATELRAAIERETGLRLRGWDIVPAAAGGKGGPGGPLQGGGGRDPEADMARAKELDRQVEALSAQGRWAEGIPLVEESLALKERAVGREHAEYALSLADMGEMLSGLGRDREAIGWIERALAVREKALGPTHDDVAKSCFNLARARLRVGDLDGAQKAAERSHAIIAKNHGPDHPITGHGLSIVAEVVEARGEYERARPQRERALAIYEKAYGREHPQVASSLQSLAMLLSRANDVEGARSLLERALAIREKVLGPAHPAVATSLNDLAIVHAKLGDPVRARACAERALSIYERALGSEHPHIAVALVNLAHIVQEAGEVDNARALAERALAIAEEALGPDHPGVAVPLQAIAQTYFEHERWDDVRPLLERALAIIEKTYGPDHILTAGALDDLAPLVAIAGESDRARAMSERALAVYERILGPEALEVSIALHTLALLAVHAGDSAAAKPAIERAVAIRDRALGPDHATTIPYVEVLADVRLLLGDAAGAREASHRALGMAERAARAMRASASPAARALHTVRLHRALAGWLEVSAKTGDVGYDEVLRVKGLTGRIAEAERRALRRAPADVRRLAEELALAEARLARLAYDIPDRARLARWRDDFARASARRDEAAAALAAKWGGFREAAERIAIGVDAIAARLGPDEALVDILCYRRAYAAWVLRGGQKGAVRVELGSAMEIHEVAGRFREAAMKATALDDPAFVESGAALRARVWAKIEDVLGPGAKTVYVVPDGVLVPVPFVALPGSAAGKLVIDERTIVYLGTAQDLVPWKEEARPGQGALLVGAVHFAEGSGFAPLPGTGLEIDTIAQALRRAGERVMMLRGKEAIEAAFRKNAPGKRLIHLATHGFLREDLRSVFDAASAQAPVAPSLARHTAVADPMLLAGVVLAAAGEEDGIFTALEAAALDLEGAELVCLSGCKTAAGFLRFGEGVLGFVRALREAGARNVVAALWPVDDEATRRLMSKLYADPRPPAETLRAAALALRDEEVEVVDRDASLVAGREVRAKKRAYAAPRYWAAFAAYGPLFKKK